MLHTPVVETEIGSSEIQQGLEMGDEEENVQAIKAWGTACKIACESSSPLYHVHGTRPALFYHAGVTCMVSTGLKEEVQCVESVQCHVKISATP